MTASSLLNSLRQTKTEMLANSTAIRSHGEKFFLVVKGSVVKDGVTFLVGSEPFRGLNDILIHVKDPVQASIKRGNETIELRKFSELLDTGAVRVNDMVVFKDAVQVPGSSDTFMAQSYETPFNSFDSEGVLKTTTVSTGYMSIEGKEYPQIVLYQTNPEVVGTISQLLQFDEQRRKELLIDGTFMANLQSEEDLMSWASAQFALKRPVTIRAIVPTEDGARESIGVKVNPVSVETKDPQTEAVYRVNSVESSMAAFIANKDVQQIVGLLRVAKQNGLKVDTFESGAAMMLEGVPTLRINDQYRNIVSEYARFQKNVFERRAITLPELNRPVLQDVALQGVLITKTVTINEPTGPRNVVRVAPGSGLLQNKTPAFMISELPTPNFPASSDMGETRDHDQYIGANRSTKDDEMFRILAAKFGAAVEVANKVSPEVATQQQATQAPVTQAPVTQTPVAQAPVTQTPVAQAPVTQVTTKPADEFGFADIPTDDSPDMDDLDQALSSLGLSGAGRSMQP